MTVAIYRDNRTKPAVKLSGVRVEGRRTAPCGGRKSTYSTDEVIRGSREGETKAQKSGAQGERRVGKVQSRAATLSLYKVLRT